MGRYLVAGRPSSAELAGIVLGAGVYAPSVHNTQPWRFAIGDQEISVFADLGRCLSVADPRGRELMISCGAAVLTIKVALRQLGYVPAAASRHNASRRRNVIIGQAHS